VRSLIDDPRYKACARTPFDSRGYGSQGVCERATQPIRLVLPDLFQDRLTMLHQHAAHVDRIIGAVAQHDLRAGFMALRRSPLDGNVSARRLAKPGLAAPARRSELCTAHD
jgi:hypothetical protein